MKTFLRGTVRAALALCIAIPGGLVLLWPLGLLFDLAGLPLFNTAALHGTLIVAWPMLSAAVFIGTWPLLGWAQRRLRERRATTNDFS